MPGRAWPRASGRILDTPRVTKHRPRPDAAIPSGPGPAPFPGRNGSLTVFEEDVDVLSTLRRLRGLRGRGGWRGMVAGVAVLVLPVGLLVDTASSASAASSTSVVGVGSGRCLEVAGGSAAAGAAVELWDCDGRVGEQWDPTSAGELRVFNDSMCLDV